MVELEKKNEIFCFEETKEYFSTSFLSEDIPLEENFNSPIKELFRDGKRRIDFVLVYQQESLQTEEGPVEGQSQDIEDDRSRIETAEKREYFLGELESVGIQLEEEFLEVFSIGDKRLKKIIRFLKRRPRETECITLHFIKLHAPFEVLCQYAEKLNYAMPYQDPDELDEFPEYQFKQSLNKTFIEKLGFSFLVPKVPPHLEPLKYRTKVFVNKNLSKYHGIGNEDTFFSSGQRCSIIENILQTTSYGPDPYGLKTGIDKLLKKKIFNQAYPLHEGCENQAKEDLGKPLTERQFLKLYWASFKPRAFFKTQPIPQIRHYLGEKVAIYFAWLGFYTKWLHVSTVMGLIIFLLGPYTLGYNIIATEACENKADTIVLCPDCDFKCDFEAIDESCLLVKISNILDNEGTVLYAAFMSFWAILFLEFWKRYQFYLQYEWDLLDYEPLVETPRPEFVITMRNRYKDASESVKKQIWKVNPITGKTEFFQEPTQIKLKILAGLSVTLTLVLAVLAILIGIIFYRAGIAPIIGLALVRISVHKDATLSAVSGLAGAMLISLTAGIIQLIFIFIMNAIYKQLAIILTKWELNRTQSEHDNSFTVKMSLFQIVNFYASPMYIAFIKGRIFVNYPGRGGILPGIVGLEHCAQYGCLLELTFQLIVIFALKQTLNNIKELGVPLVKVGIRELFSIFQNKKKGTRQETQRAWERDRKLEAEEETGLFEDYLELVIQFGFVTIFATAFPLAPLLALINNYFEIRLDAIKYLRLTRRTVPERVQDIGPWYSLLDGIAKFAVITNSLLIPFLGSTVNLWIFKSSYPARGDFLNTTLATIPIRDFLNRNSFPDFRYRSLRVAVNNSIISYEEQILFPTTFYCTEEANTGKCVERFVNANTTNATDCCSYLNLTGTSDRHSECTNNGTKFCCVDALHKESIEYLDAQAYTGNKTASDCCDVVIAKFVTNRSESENRTLYYRDEGDPMDPSNPKCEKEFFSGCNVYFVNDSSTCRFDPGYEVIEHMSADQKEFYYKTMLYKLLFAIFFEHFVFLIVSVVAYVVPDMPEAIRNQIKRDKYISKSGTKSKGVRKSKPSIFERGARARVYDYARLRELRKY